MSAIGFCIVDDKIIIDRLLDSHVSLVIVIDSDAMQGYIAGTMDLALPATCKDARYTR